MSTQPSSDEQPAAATEAAASVRFQLGGLCCRVVCVDDIPPMHLTRPGSSRVRERYAADEVAHFQLGGHRWSLVVEREQPVTAFTDIHTQLTNRELQIVQLICNGLLTKQVSDRLHISEFTVRSYLKLIYRKLGVRSRGAMVYAYAQSFARTRRDDD